MIPDPHLPSGRTIFKFRGLEEAFDRAGFLNLLDGFEDLEYLALLEKKAGRDAADAAAAKITQDLQHFTKDPAEFEKVRREVAEKISGG